MATRTKKKRSLAWRIIDAIITLILVIILIFLIINAIMSAIDSTYIPKFFGHQLYTIVTGSMEPSIPVGSLVSAKSVTDKNKDDYRRSMEIDAMENLTAEQKVELKRQEGVKGLEFGTVIVFNATTVAGEKRVVTHYFAKFEDGYVRTFPEQFRERVGTDGKPVLDENGNVIMDNVKITSLDEDIQYDGYDYTKIDDIRAIYSWHLEGVGKFLLFLKTPQALIMHAVIAVIILCGYLLIKRINKQEDAKNKSIKAINGDSDSAPNLVELLDNDIDCEVDNENQKDLSKENNGTDKVHKSKKK